MKIHTSKKVIRQTAVSIHAKAILRDNLLIARLIRIYAFSTNANF